MPGDFIRGTMEGCLAADINMQTQERESMCVCYEPAGEWRTSVYWLQVDLMLNIPARLFPLKNRAPWRPPALCFDSEWLYLHFHIKVSMRSIDLRKNQSHITSVSLLFINSSASLFISAYIQLSKALSCH